MSSHYSRGSIDTITPYWQPPPSLRRPSPPEMPGSEPLPQHAPSSSRSPPRLTGGESRHRQLHSQSSRSPPNMGPWRHTASTSRSPRDTRGMDRSHHHHTSSSSRSPPSVTFKGTAHRKSPSQGSQGTSNLTGGDRSHHHLPSQSSAAVSSLNSSDRVLGQLPSQTSAGISSLNSGQRSYRPTPSSSRSPPPMTAADIKYQHRHSPSGSSEGSASERRRGSPPIVTNLEPTKKSRRHTSEQREVLPLQLPKVRDFGSESSIESLQKPVNTGPHIAGWRMVMLYIALTAGLFLSFLDGSITATAIYTIGNDFDARQKINWIALAYTLADVGCAVLLPSLGDLIGRKHAYTMSMLMFFGFSIACGVSKNINQLIGFRVLQGIGGSGLYSLAFVILPDISSFKMKQWIGPFTGMTVAVSGVMGPILGAVLTEYTTWRWIFYMNIPISVIALTLFLIAWPMSPEFQQYSLLSFQDFDFLGNIILVAASVSVVFAFQEAGVKEASWGNILFIAPLAGSIMCWLGFFGWELLLNKSWKPNDFMEPLFPTRLFKNRIYMANLLYTLLSGFVFFALIYNIPVRFQVVNESSVLAAGVALLPMLISSALGSMISGACNAKKDYSFYVLCVASFFMAVGCGLLSMLKDQVTKQSTAYGHQVLVGFGFGLGVSASSIVASVHCELRDHAIAQGFMSQARVLGGSLGIAASTAILGVHERSDLPGLSTAASQTLLSNLANLTPAEMVTVRRIYSDSFTQILQVCAGIAAGTFLVALMSYQPEILNLSERVQELEEKERRRLEDLEMRELHIATYHSPAKSRTGSNNNNNNNNSNDIIEEERDGNGNLIYHLPPPPPPSLPSHHHGPIASRRNIPNLTGQLPNAIEKMEDEHTHGTIPVFLSPNTAQHAARARRAAHGLSPRDSALYRRASLNRESLASNSGGWAPWMPTSTHFANARPPSWLHPANRPSQERPRNRNASTQTTDAEAVLARRRRARQRDRDRASIRNSLSDWLVWSPDSNTFRGPSLNRHQGRGKKTGEYF